MQTTPSNRELHQAWLGLALFTTWAGWVMGGGSGTGAEAMLSAPISLPTRISVAEASAQFTPPELPPQAELTRPIRLQRTVRVPGRTGKHQQIITRNHQRAHVAIHGDDHAWLFIRNPIDGRRVSGQLIDHSRKVILIHDGSELRDSGIAQGWANILKIGKDTPLSQTDTQRMPIHSTSNGVPDLRLLQDPTVRFPDYEVYDMVDWREEHHSEPGHIDPHSH